MNTRRSFIGAALAAVVGAVVPRWVRAGEKVNNCAWTHGAVWRIANYRVVEHDAKAATARITFTYTV